MCLFYSIHTACFIRLCPIYAYFLVIEVEKSGKDLEKGNKVIKNVEQLPYKEKGASYNSSVWKQNYGGIGGIW